MDEGNASIKILEVPRWTKKSHNKNFSKSLKRQKDTPKQIAAKCKQIEEK